MFRHFFSRGASYLVPTLTVHLFKSDANLLDAKKQQNAG